MEHFSYEDPFLQKATVKQINYYFDTDDLSMNRQNITCRIRLKDGKYKATMKQHSLNSDHSTETEVKIYDGLDSNVFTDMGLKLQGELITERCIILKDSVCEAVLDKNEYLGHTDYELEIEYSLKHEKDAQAILQFFCNMLTRKKSFLPHKKCYFDSPNISSKSKRFFKRKVLNNQMSHEGENLMDEKLY